MSSRGRTVRRVGVVVTGAIGLGLTAIAASRIGLDSVVNNIVRSDATWVLVATALMVASLFLRAGSWFAIAKSALPRTPLRRRDVASATMIGVLMSATLPARLGEPARAMVLARRTGRMRENFPVLLGTLVSQTALNIFALVMLGVIIVNSTDLFHTDSQRLFLISMAPLLILLAVILAPVFVKQNGNGRVARVAEAIREALLKVRGGTQVVFRDPRRGARRVLPADSAPGSSSSAPAGRCSPRSGSTTSASAPPRPCSSPSTSPPSCRRPRRTSASSSSR